MRTVLITGATDGIGLELARHYQLCGARLILVGRRPLTDLAGNLFHADNYCQVDLADPDCAEYVATWVRQHGFDLIDLIIFNAGVGYIGGLDRQTLANIRTLVDVNLWAPVALTHALLPNLDRTGKLVYISSVASALPGPNYAVYTATKAAIDGFARNLRLELAAISAGIGVQIIFPGATRTNLHVKSGADPDALGWSRFPAPASVARLIVRAIERGQTQATIGRLNRLVRIAGRAAPHIVDRIFVRPHGSVGRYQNPPHCVITGAADGIGRALAMRFAAAGYSITGIDVEKARAEQTVAELRASGADARFIMADLAVAAEIDAALAALRSGMSPIDVFVHSAGVSAVGPFQGSALTAQRRVLDVNLLAPLLMTADVLRNGRLTPDATLVFIASLSHFVGYPGATVYAATKDGLTAFARSIRAALAPRGIRVLTVFPGPTRTAHARRYSPHNRREHRRMPPEVLAADILRAVHSGRRDLVPGLGNRAFAVTGRLLPWLVEPIVQRTLFLPLLARKGFDPQSGSLSQ